LRINFDSYIYATKHFLQNQATIMYTKNLLLAAIVLFAINSFAQNNFKFSPEKPYAGSLITITYSCGGDISYLTTMPEAVAYSLGNKGQTATDLKLKKSGNQYIANFKTDTSDNFVYFSFSADKKFDNNFNNGYWIQLYNGDSIKKGANTSLSLYYQFYGGSAGVEANTDKALEYIEKEFQMYPASKKDNLVSYVRLYSKAKKDDVPAFIQKQIEEEIKSGLKDENDYSAIQNLYLLAKLPQQAKLMGDLKKEKFPNGQWASGEYIQKYFAEQDATKKEAMLDSIILKMKKDSSWEYLEPSLAFFKSQLPNAYASKNDYEGMKNAVKKYEIKGAELATVYNNTAWEMQKTDSNLDKAEQISKEATEWASNEWNKPSEPKPPYLTEKQWSVSRANNYGMYADTYAMIMYKKGDYKKGFPYTKDAAIKLSKGQDPDLNNTYSLLAEKTLPAKEYVPQLEQFVKDGKTTSDIKDVLKRAYIKKKGADKGFDDYITTLEKDSYLKMMEDIRKGVLSDKAPAFTLVDLKGSKVNVHELKNKIVVVDFWATWCGPCKASFPGMQKMVTKYKDDSLVRFVFVDTWEQEGDKEKKAADFIASNKYDFHVLMDNEGKVVEQFKVTGIPTKFIIDKTGTIRFKSVGFNGSDDKLVSELSAMIDMAKNM